MSAEDVAVIMGAVPLTILSFFSFWLAHNKRWAAHGREALVVWGTVGLLIMVTRVLNVFGSLPAFWVRNILSVGYLAALIVLAQIVFIINGVKDDV